MAEGPISLREYGRRRGCSGEAVRRAIQSGRLVESVTRDARGRPKIADPALADSEWGGSTSPAQQRDQGQIGDAVSRSKGGDGKTRAPSTTPVEPKGDNGGGEEDGGNATAARGYQKARAVKEHYNARIAQLEYEEKAGKLVDADEVRRQYEDAGRKIKQGMQAIPDRVAPIVAAESDPKVVHEMISKEVEQVLKELADSNAAEASAEKPPDG